MLLFSLYTVSISVWSSNIVISLCLWCLQPLKICLSSRAASDTRGHKDCPDCISVFALHFSDPSIRLLFTIHHLQWQEYTLDRSTVRRKPQAGSTGRKMTLSDPLWSSRSMLRHAGRHCHSLHPILSPAILTLSCCRPQMLGRETVVDDMCNSSTL